MARALSSGTAPLGGEGKGSRAWQRMLSGRRLDLLDPSPVDVEIADIAHGLARVARWNGQTIGEHAFSVAQHSLLVETLFGQLYPAAARADRLAALLHDAPEFVIGDLISPFKAAIGDAYKTVEQRLFDAVRQRFGLPDDTDGLRTKRIKLVDTVAAYHEAVTLAGFAPDEARRIFGAPRLCADACGPWLVPMPTPRVQAAFLDRFAALDHAR